MIETGRENEIDEYREEQSDRRVTGRVTEKEGRVTEKEID